jgi:hypothetical protein
VQKAGGAVRIAEALFMVAEGRNTLQNVRAIRSAIKAAGGPSAVAQALAAAGGQAEIGEALQAAGRIAVAEALMSVAPR